MAAQSLRRGVLKSIASRMVNPWLLYPLYKSVQCSSYATQRIVDIGQPTDVSHPHLLAKGEITPGISSDEYISRRKRLLELLPEKGLAIIASASVKMMTDVVPYPYWQDADYLYITGCAQPGGVAVLSDEIGLCMFMPDPDPQDVLWQGPIAGIDAALDYFKADKAFSMSKMREILPGMIRHATKVYHNVKTALPSYMAFEAFRKLDCSNKVQDISYLTHELRWVKSSSEVNLMRQSASIACQSLLQTMLLSRTCPEESKLAAKVEYECKMRGAQRMAFHPVVGGGANASVIHYSRNDQKEILYDLILETNKECVKLCKPGVSIQQIHNYSVQMLQRGLRKMGILKDSSINSYHRLNPTSIGHYLGMDVHDSAMIRNDRLLQPGVVITIEPGVYIPSSCDVPERYQGIGIRIEDDVLITETGHEVLTGSMPKEIADIMDRSSGAEVPSYHHQASGSPLN